MTEQSLFTDSEQDKADLAAVSEEKSAVTEKPKSEEKTAETTTEEVKVETEELAKAEPVKVDQRKLTAQERVQKSRQQVAEARQQLEAERKARVEFEAKVQERLDKLLSNKAPDPELDPIAFARHQTEQLAATAKERDELKKRELAAKEQQEATQKFTQWISDTLADFVEEHPDYSAAETYLLQAEIKRLVDEEGATLEGAQQEVNAALYKRAIHAYERGWNPCKWVYAQAKKSGYKGTESAAEKTVQDGEKTKPSGDLKALADGKVAARSARGTGGTGKSLTVEELAAMSDEDFTKYAEDHQKLRKLFGE